MGLSSGERSRPMKLVRCLAGLALAAGITLGVAHAVPAQAAGTKALVISFDDDGFTPGTYNDILGSSGDARFDLAHSGYLAFSGSGVPTLAQLSPYDAVLAYSNHGASPALGDVLADYVDGGG